MISITLESVSRVDIEDEWNFSNDTEFTMHSIHTYPAKFPAFIAKKAFDYAKAEGVNIKKVADIFCGCGTVALEAKMHGKDFWGCDINPVATLIAKVKSESYDIAKIEEYFLLVSTRYPHVEVSDDAYEEANERLKYWFTQNSYIQIPFATAFENSGYPYSQTTLSKVHAAPYLSVGVTMVIFIPVSFNPSTNAIVSGYSHDVSLNT